MSDQGTRRKIGRKLAVRCPCGCYPVERWWQGNDCYLIECTCCGRDVMHRRLGTARVLWHILVSATLGTDIKAQG